MWKPWLYLLGAILFEVLATASLTASQGLSRGWPTLMATVGYVVSFYLLSLTLRTIPVGVAYAIWSGVGVVLISLVGWWGFKQRLDSLTLLGMGLIVAGVVLIKLCSKTAVP